VPQIQPWEILVKLGASGVCGTDILLASGKAGPCRDILGHEGVGRVVQVGAGVDPSVVLVGQRVGVAWVRDICGQCACCRVPGGETRCVEQFNSGRKLDGTFAEYCVVSSRYVFVLPAEGDDLPDETIAPILCGGVTAYKALKVCNARPGEWVAILGGGGGVGALGVQYAKAMGYRVAAIDVGQAKKEFCLSLGAEVFIDAVDEDVASAMQAATRGAMAKAVIVAVGSGKAYESAIPLLAMFGTMVVVGIPPPGQNISLHPLEFIDRGIKIEGIAVGTRTDTIEALEFVRRGVVKPVVTPTSLDQLNSIYGLVASVSTRTNKRHLPLREL
jgi:propanol-preferring alcohol dehydrogenase